MKYKKLITTIILSTTISSILSTSACALENTQVSTESVKTQKINTSTTDELLKNILALFTNDSHSKIANTSCGFQYEIDDLCEQVKKLPESQEKLELSELLYLANNLYFEARGVLSLRERAKNVNENLNNYFVDNNHNSLTSDCEDFYYGGLYDVVIRYQKLGLPENTPSIEKDFGNIKHAYELFKEGKILVNIPDRNFQRALNDKLKLPENNSNFEESQLETITDLDLTNYTIKDLTGINALHNLSTLKLEDREGINLGILVYSKETTLSSLKTLVVKNMSQDNVYPVRWLPNLKTFKADGGNVSDASPIIDNVPNVKITNQKIIAPKQKLNDLGLNILLYNLLISNYGVNRLCCQLDSFKLSNNGHIINNTAIWGKNDLKNLQTKQVSASWNSDKFSGEYIIPFE